jgi:hypothetical protein
MFPPDLFSGADRSTGRSPVFMEHQREFVNHNTFFERRRAVSCAGHITPWLASN